MKPLLLPLSWVYGAGVALRNQAFNQAWLLTKELPCPVISVGNLTVGGTGKTPMVIMLAEKLLGMGIKPGILSRGYRRRSKGTVVVSDGRRKRLDAALAGDEPALMARRLPKVPVVVDKVRVRGGLYMMKQFKLDVILLDDGFQHRWLHRDLDVVMIDAQRPMHKEKLLPAGRLRESASSLKRADLLVFTRTDDHHPTTSLMKRIGSSTEAPILKSTHKPAEWMSLQHKIVPLYSGPDLQNPLLISGIASPKDFERSVRSLGVEPAAHLVFPDHMSYNRRILNRIAQVYRDVKADSVITTEKDLVKFPLMLQALKVWALRISLEITEGEEELDRWIAEKIRSKLEKKEKESA